jgi:hypothetical protein
MTSRGGLFSNLNLLLRVSATYPSHELLNYSLSGWPYINNKQDLLSFILISSNEKPKEIVRVNKIDHATLGHPELKRLNQAYHNHFQPLIKPSIIKIVDDFSTENFDHNTLGIHIRSTDRATNSQSKKHWRPLSMELVCNEVDYYLNYFNCTKVFVATDFSGYREALVNKFGSAACYYSNRISDSAKKAPHLNPENGELVAQEGFIDMLLLSRCNALLRTTSNLTVFTLSVQKNLPFVDLSLKHSMFLASNEEWLQNS